MENTEIWLADTKNKMNEKFQKNAKVKQLTYMLLWQKEEKGIIYKDPYCLDSVTLRCISRCATKVKDVFGSLNPCLVRLSM